MDKKIKCTPTGELVLVQQIFEKIDNKTTSGILLSTNEDTECLIPTDRCNVLRIGKDVTFVKEGDVGLLSSTVKGHPVELNGKHYMIISQKDIIAYL